jgi:hypothetical protein
MFKNSNLKEMDIVSIKGNSLVMLFKKVVAYYCNNYSKHIDIFCDQSAEFVNAIFSKNKERITNFSNRNVCILPLEYIYWLHMIHAVYSSFPRAALTCGSL